jgi:Fe-S cluster biogenesis protein NfuA
MKVQAIQPTPNPNAFKFVVDRALARPGQSANYQQPEEARQNVLVQGLFAVPGVAGVFLCDNFVTVSMTAQADWRGVAEQVTRMLESHLGDDAPERATAPEPAATAPRDPLASLPRGGDPKVLAQINALLDDRVRPALAGDGGGLEVVGLEGKTLFIRYQGACGSCPSSIQGTMVAIQNLLQSEVDEELVVATA